MLHFEGAKEFEHAPESLWERLGDARFLAGCIPGVEAVSRAEPDEAACVIRPGFSFVRGTLELTIRIVARVPPRSLRLNLRSKGIGSSSTVEASLLLAPSGEGTRVDWSAEVTELGGLLKAVPQGLIKAAAQNVIADVWTALAAKLKES
jgi:carbon monoxide dehydrogenase subunit G